MSAAAGPLLATRAGHFAFSLPYRAARKAWRVASRIARRTADRQRCTYFRGEPGKIRTYLGGLRASELDLAPHLTDAIELWCDHRFDLLGSGWVHVAHGVIACGLEGHRYDSGPRVDADADGRWLASRLPERALGYSVQVWKAVDRGYQPIDWQRDFKSGYRWSEHTWYLDIPYGHLPGVDVKVPWELARMQHLPALAMAYAHHQGAERERYLREFRNQILDFIATNPPRYGVNWRTAMDVSIRLANWLLAYDLFLAFGGAFDDAFIIAFARSVVDHGAHVASNLEWDPWHRGNHYLADLVGLLWAGAYSTDPRNRGWTTLGVRELVNEVPRQFHEDGGNFEASTCYHRLSAELAAYGTAIACAAGFRGQFPQSHFQRLGAAATFTEWLTKPSGRVVQIGDNDSGRLFRLAPQFTPMRVADARARFANMADYAGLPDDHIVPVEDHLAHAHVTSTIGALLGAAPTAQAPDSAIVARLVAAPRENAIAAPAPPHRGQRQIGQQARQRTEYVLPPGTTRGSWTMQAAFPSFGVYVFRNARAFASVRCGGLREGSMEAHAHSDQLAIELEVDGMDILTDPGSYIYTPLPTWRNAYRSALAHAVPRHGVDETTPLARDAFTYVVRDVARCDAVGADFFRGSMVVQGVTITRQLLLEADRVIVEDFCDCPPGCNALALGAAAGSRPPFSPGYGIRHV